MEFGNSPTICELSLKIKMIFLSNFCEATNFQSSSFDFYSISRIYQREPSDFTHNFNTQRQLVIRTIEIKLKCHHEQAVESHTIRN